ncbi:hypothetical protein K461DRAFT_281546 [Myriangium duriaei CBS 260.36]|uniref:Rhodopsin domain-containing protein n=1 Tax=Myriangium duriaei CBS 260.36 TaxID=1168546 RepID=A0A9P4IWW0_9PEZI|nr:hypothetical protein K461DRAFT_281546 [Myriangium duriaei CBS 260.36]
MATHFSALGGDGPKLLAIGWTVFGVGTISTVLRYFVASRIDGRWRWDFIWAALATFITLGSVINFTLAILNGVGNDVKNVTLTNVFNAIFYVRMTVYFGLVGITAAKFSVIALLIQIEGPLIRRRRTALFIIAAFFSIVNLIYIPIAATECVPYNKLWYRYLPGSCPREQFVDSLGKFQGYTSSVTDLILALWPISIVRHLSHPLPVKIKICLLMGAGTLPGLISIIRTTVIPTNKVVTSNVTRAYSDFLMYCSLELGLVFILTSIPVLRPLYKRIWEKVKHSLSPKSAGQDEHGSKDSVVVMVHRMDLASKGPRSDYHQASDDSISH